MLELFKAHLLPGVKIVKVKESGAYYIITTEYRGHADVTYLHKTCAPGRQNHIVHQALCMIMAGAAIDENDPDTAKLWLDRNTKFSRWAWEYSEYHNE